MNTTLKNDPDSNIKQILNLSANVNARIAGIFYTLFLIAAILADTFAAFALTDSQLLTEKILANEPLFRFGILLNLTSGLFFLLAAWGLYVLLRPINKNLALSFFVLNAVGVAIQCLSVGNLLACINILNGSEFQTIFQPNELQALVNFYIEMYNDEFLIAQIFYGAWLLPLGLLIYKSIIIPKVIGILVIIDCIAILFWVFQYILLPELEVLSYFGLLISFFTEFTLAGWLLVKGVKI